MKVLILKMLGRDQKGRVNEATMVIQVEGKDQEVFGYRVTAAKWEERPDDLASWEDESDEGSLG